jgi:hypothetical protein
MEKSVTITIDPDDHKKLVASHYRLCVAKKVEGIYSVTWQSYDTFLASSPISWGPTYQLFGASSAGVPIRGQTNAVAISVGQTATLDSNGNLGNAVTGGPPDQITLINNYKSIYPGLNCAFTGPDGVQQTTPVFLAPYPIVTGTEQLKPVEMVKVWFEQPSALRLAFHASSHSVEIDLTNADSATRLYQNGNWSDPGPSRL